MKVKKIPGNVYAILRFDDYLSDATPIEHRVTVTRVVADLAAAKAEVARLNALNKSHSRYVWQATRLGDWVPDEDDFKS